MEDQKPLLGPRFNQALQFAAETHAAQLRKGTSVPYVSHLFSVTALVLEHGGGEDTAVAALLHDAVEDCGGMEMLKEIQTRFGSRVADIVDGCTDAYVKPKPDWDVRKMKYLAHLDETTAEVLLVSLADKLHNARSILRDLRQAGNIIWDKFNGKKDGSLWYYTALVDKFKKLIPTNPMVAELERVVDQIKEIASSEQ